MAKNVARTIFSLQFGALIVLGNMEVVGLCSVMRCTCDSRCCKGYCCASAL